MVAPRATRSHGTFDAYIVEVREDVGRSRDTTLCSFDQRQRNGSGLDGGMGMIMVGSTDDDE